MTTEHDERERGQRVALAGEDLPPRLSSDVELRELGTVLDPSLVLAALAGIGEPTA